MKRKEPGFASVSAVFPGDETALGQWPRPRYGAEWDEATRDAPKLMAFWPPNPPAEDVLVRETVLVRSADPAPETKRQAQRLQREKEQRKREFVWALQAASEAAGYEFSVASKGHWLWGSVDADELVLWVRRSVRANKDGAFPWAPDDRIRTFDASTLEWAGDLRVRRVGVRPRQGTAGGAATGYITATPFTDTTL